PDDHVTLVCGITADLQQNPGYFLTAHQNVVGPLQPQTLQTVSSQCAMYRQAHRQRQRLEQACSTIHPHDRTVVNVLRKWANPFTPTTTPPCTLALGKKPKR